MKTLTLIKRPMALSPELFSFTFSRTVAPGLRQPQNASIKNAGFFVVQTVSKCFRVLHFPAFRSPPARISHNRVYDVTVGRYYRSTESGDVLTTKHTRRERVRMKTKDFISVYWRVLSVENKGTGMSGFPNSLTASSLSTCTPWNAAENQTRSNLIRLNQTKSNHIFFQLAMVDGSIGAPRPADSGP